MAQNETYLTTKNQPLKVVTQQDLREVKETLECLQSCNRHLETLQLFFASKPPLNKKKIIKDYHADAQLFQVFFNDFRQQTDTLTQQLDALVQREKVRKK